MCMRFYVDNSIDSFGTSLKAYTHAKYSELEKLFGEPRIGDEYKVSGEWVFTNSSGEVFTLYDWKQTELYSDGLPSVKQFRKSDEVTEFNIGGKTSCIEFVQWLNEKIRDSRK